MTKKKEEGLRVRNTPMFKLKDKVNRHFQAINLFKQFGFIPEVIIVEKVAGVNNGIVVRAVLTEAEMKKEDERIKKNKELVKAMKIPKKKEEVKK